MAGSTNNGCTLSCNASTPTCCGGLARSTSGCVPTGGSPSGGAGSSIETPGCSHTGHGCAHSPDCDEKSGMTGDCHVPFRGSLGVRFPGATRLIIRAPKSLPSDKFHPSLERGFL